jgi:lysophospholipase
MTDRTLRTTLALALCLLMAGVAHAQVLAADPWTDEATLDTPAGAEAIERFWRDRGQGATFSGRGGLQLAFREFLQPDLAIEKGAIVIASGRTESMLKYKELVFDLYRAGWSVYIHDHRGQGLSERERAVARTPQKGHVGRFADYADDLRRFIATFVPAGRHRNLFLLAHSMGGAVSALLLEGGGPEVQRLRAAALSSPMLEIKGLVGLPADLVSCRVAKDLVKQGKATGYVALGKDWQADAFKPGNPYTSSRARFDRVAAQELAEPKVRLGSATHGWLDQACQGAQRARTQSAKVGTPVLVLVAGADAIVHNDGAVQFCRGLPKAGPNPGCQGPGGGPVVIDGAQHEMFIERDELRRAALNRVLAFFDSQRR